MYMEKIARRGELVPRDDMPRPVLGLLIAVPASLALWAALIAGALAAIG